MGTGKVGQLVVGKGQQCVICPAGRRDSLSCQTGGGTRKASEKDLGWALRNVQETTIWTSVTNSLSPGLPTPTRQELPGAGLGLVNKARLFSLTASF